MNQILPKILHLILISTLLLTPTMTAALEYATPSARLATFEAEQAQLIPSPSPSSSPSPIWQTVDGVATTQSPVVLGQTYHAPQNDQVTVIFTKLPPNSGTLTIKQVIVSQLFTNGLNPVTDIAYDITSTMEDGTFEYNLTLPTPTTQNVEVKASEDGQTFVTLGGVSPSDGILTITGLNHFTIFVVAGIIDDDNHVETFDESNADVLINEFLYSPSSGNEWIELYNTSSDPVDLSGWRLEDGNDQTTDLDLSGEIAGNGRVVFEHSSGWLNNTGDTISLKNSDEELVDRVTYKQDGPGDVVDAQDIGSVSADQSVGRVRDGWTIDNEENFWDVFPTPSKGEANNSRVYVDISYNGNEFGTFNRPFTSIQNGINEVSAGGTIYVTAGDYYESLSIGQSVTLNGAGVGQSTIFDGDCGSGVVNVYASNVTIQNFTINDDYCGASAIFLNSEIADVTIKNNEIINGSRGIEIDSDNSSIQILGNTIYDHEDFGIWLNGATNSTIQSNEIYNNSSGGIRLDDGDFSGTMFSQNNIHDNSGYGIFSYRSNVTFSPLTVSNNTISNNANDGINFRYVPSGATLNIQSNTIEGNGGDGGGGIYVNRLTDSTLSIIENNIRSNSSEGIRVNTVSNSTFALSSNTIANNSSTGIYLSGGGSSVESSTVAISDNTVSSNDGDGIYADVIASSTFNVLNNTIGENDGNGIYICAEGECTSSTLTISGNFISGNDSNGLYLYNILASTVVIDDNDILSNNEKGISMQYIGVSAPSDPSTVTLTDNTISGNSFDGIYLGDVDEVSQVQIGSGNTIATNSSSGIYLDSGVTGVLITGNTIESHSPESQNIGIAVRSATGNQAHQNVISGNGVGVENQDEENFFDATENYWGHASGPRHGDLNPDGLGDQVSDKVLFSPFYEDQQLSLINELEFKTNDIASFVENGVFDLPDDEEGQDLVQFLTLRQQIKFKVSEGGEEDNVVLPDGVRIERSDDAEFEWDNLKIDDVIEETLSGFASGEIVEEALQWGIPNVELEFNQPITISIFVGTALNGKTLSVRRSTSGSSGWTDVGIVAPATCVVTNGICTFQATKASYFVATSTVPTPTPAPAAKASSASSGGGGGGGGSASPPSCDDQKPGSAPFLQSAIPSLNSVTLGWSKAQDPVSYYLITYGLSKGAQQFGNPNVGGKDTTSYTISSLSGGTTYYFKVRAGNGCMPGDFSNELVVTPGGGSITGPAAGFEAGILATSTKENVGIGESTASAQSSAIAQPQSKGASLSFNAKVAVVMAVLLLGGFGLFRLLFK